MNKGMLLLSAILVSGLLAVPAPAPAQDEGQGYSISLGVFYPTKSAVRRATSDTWFGASLGYNFQTSEPTESGYYYKLGVSAGYYGSDDLYNIPVQLTFTGYLNEQFYYQAGAGVGFAKKFKNINDTQQGTNDTQQGTETMTGFVFSVGFGYNFNAGTTPASLMVGYIVQSGTSDQHTGFTGMLSFSF